MSFDSPTGAKTPASLPLQFVHIEIAPLIDGHYSVAMEATCLDEANLEFVGQHLAHERVNSLDAALGVIRNNVALLATNL